MDSMFIERLDGKIVNISLIQTIYIDPEDNTDVIWYMRNGETYREDLATQEEAESRYNYLKGLLLGTTIAELEQTITEKQNTIVSLNQQVDNATAAIVQINGEEA